jgi:prepilin-type N-terminal cleavage/methylation domain-containing protein
MEQNGRRTTVKGGRDMELRRSRVQAGFTLIELLVTLALIGILAAWGYPALLHTMDRQRLTSAAREAAIYCQLARIEAIKHGAQTVVVYQSAATCSLGVPCMLAFIDNGGTDPAVPDRLYTPATDQIIEGPWPLPRGVILEGPSGSKEGPDSIDAWDVGSTPADGPVFLNDGSALAEGAFRFADGRGNYLETRVQFAGTGKVVVRKYFGGDVATDWWTSDDKSWQW